MALFPDFVRKFIITGLAVLLAELIFRLLTIIKEFILFQKHYPVKDRSTTIINYGLTFTFSSKCFFSVILILPLLEVNKQQLLENAFDQIHIIPIYLIVRWIKLNRSGFDIADWIRSDFGLDYATGMAANYFHGYLHLQLPNKGDGVIGIRERMEIYENKHDVDFAIKRLFILVPNSLHSKPKLESKILTKAAPLEVVMKDRAGVSRPFKNDVYRFTEKIRDKTYYISVEGATPLLSFYESMNFDLTRTPEMKNMQREILLKFYKSIKKFISDCPDTRMECEIVYYNDYTIDGKPTDVGYVLKHHIERMWSEGRD